MSFSFVRFHCCQINPFCFLILKKQLNMDKRMPFLGLVSILILLVNLHQNVTPYSLENCEIHDNAENETKVLCYHRNLSEVPAHLPSKVVFLDLSENRIASLRKNSFSNLIHLHVLNISQNQIHHIEEGAFVNTCHLEILNLTGNQLHLISSPMFAGLRNLTILLLGNNQIDKIETSAFVHLEKLKVIDLSSNRLHALNAMDAIFNMESLEKLHIKDNNLQNFSTKEIISGTILSPVVAVTKTSSDGHQ
nr:PREDICTED: leucine-rich repeat and immunoglobulin-like domain-containing nogo receptor-interacting protein 1 [Anolis carolinensis]|eukprot:XP_008102869.1 PREDICTED: leucine-rich repeat and immunoglobulin-like domain-containing nogo receptor-interacting protein 1 [Anolis carolinensis]